MNRIQPHWLVSVLRQAALSCFAHSVRDCFRQSGAVRERTWRSVRKRTWLIVPALIVSALLLSAGCAGSDHDALVKESIICWEEAAQVLETIKDRESGMAAEPKLKSILVRMEDLNRKARQLPHLSPAELQALEAGNEKAASAVLARVRQASHKALAIPGCREIIVHFNRSAAMLSPH